MIVTTTPNIEGKRIVRYCGVIAGEAILVLTFLKICLLGSAILWVDALALMNES